MYVALKDLEIRGAGNLLGGEQSGHIAGVGFDLYVRMIGEAVTELKGDGPAERPEVRVELPVNAHIPHDYVPGERLRLEAYTRIAAIDSAEDVAEVRDELADRYGPPPEPVDNLLSVARLRARARRAGLTDITQQGSYIRFAPVELPDSRQVRVQRLYPKTVLKPAVRSMLVPVPRAAPGRRPGQPVPPGAPLLRDADLLTWCAELIEAVRAAHQLPRPYRWPDDRAGGTAGAPEIEKDTVVLRTPITLAAVGSWPGRSRCPPAGRSSWARRRSSATSGSPSATLAAEVSNLNAAYQANKGKVQLQFPAVADAAAGAQLAGPVPGPGSARRAAGHHRDPGADPGGAGVRGRAGASRAGVTTRELAVANGMPPDQLTELGRYVAIEEAVLTRMDGGTLPTSTAAQTALGNQFNTAQCRAAKSLDIQVNPQFGELDYSELGVVPAPPKLAAGIPVPSSTATAAPQLTPHC